ncbi:hypothetical protein BH23ACT2_BH23ACT2_21280 [soil metagenome]
MVCRAHASVPTGISRALDLVAQALEAPVPGNADRRHPPHGLVDHILEKPDPVPTAPLR